MRGVVMVERRRTPKALKSLRDAAVGEAEKGAKKVGAAAARESGKLLKAGAKKGATLAAKESGKLAKAGAKESGKLAKAGAKKAGAKLVSETTKVVETAEKKVVRRKK
jgi:hypothetical protein